MEQWFNISESQGFYQDHAPVVSSDGNACICCIWVRFEREYESICASLIKDGMKSQPIYIFRSKKGCGNPQIISKGEGVFHISWLVLGEKTNLLYHTVIADGKAHEPKIIHQGQSELSQKMAFDSNNRLFLVWSSKKDNKHRIVCKYLSNGEWSDVYYISDESYDSMRPQIAEIEKGKMIIVWDTYSDSTGFQIHGAFFSDTLMGEEWKISNDDGWQLKPGIVADIGKRAYVSWLLVKDIENEHGVVDQINTIRLAEVSTKGDTTYIKDGNDLDVVSLAWGLVPEEQVWGYLGRRRHPMLKLISEGGLFLMWERKSEWDGSTLDVSGTLCGKIWDGVKWTGEMSLHEGKRFYEADGFGPISNNKLIVSARENHQISHADLVVSEITLGTKKLDNRGIKGWKFVNWEEKKELPKDRVLLDGVEYKLFWGDPHLHSALSADAEGEIDELIYYGRDKANLDFCGFQDNDDCYLALTQYEWFLNQEFSKKYSKDNDIILLPGFEWTCVEQDGTRNHRSIIFDDYFKPLFRYTDISGDLMKQLDEYSDLHGALLHPHHQEWKLHNHLKDVNNVEICSGWAQYIRDSENINEHLKRGRKFGFVGGSDNHRRNPGLGGALTGLYATELTLKGLIEAFKAGRSFVTDGNHCVAKIWVNGAFMGGVKEIKGIPEIKIEIQGEEDIKAVNLIRNGEIIKEYAGGGRHFEKVYRDNDIHPGYNFYYISVEQNIPWRDYQSNIAPARGPYAWTSPVWVHVKDL